MSSTRVMVITGARKGIGRSLAEYYLEKGLTVVGCSRKESDLDHDFYLHTTLDVGDDIAVKRMILDVNKRFGRLDYLINNAGIAAMNHSLLTPTVQIKAVLDTNVTGMFIAIREASRFMMKKRFGRIVNFTTVAVPLNLEGEAIYVASKAATEKLTKILAKELGPFGVTVNAIGPTPIETDLIRAVPKEKIEQLIKQQAISRIGNFDDVCNVIDFFISEKSDFVTGQTVYLGGVS